MIEACATGKIQCVVSHLDIERFGFYASVFDGEIQCHIFHLHVFQTWLFNGIGYFVDCFHSAQTKITGGKAAITLHCIQYRAHGCIQICQYINTSGEITFQVFEDRSHLLHHVQFFVSLCETDIGEFESGFHFRLLYVGSGVVAVHDHVATHGVHGEVFHIHFAIFYHKLAVHIIERHLIE